MQIPKETNCPTNTIDRSLEFLENGDSVICATQRLKHLIDDAYNQKQLELGKLSWETAPVFTWNVWLRHLWSNFENFSNSFSDILLSSEQTGQLWEEVISQDVRKQNDKDFEYLLWHINSTAAKAKDAYQLLCSYQISTAEFKDRMSDDIAHFVNWLEQYQKSLQRNQWMDVETLPKRLVSQEYSDFDATGLSLTFVGFVDWTPMHQSFVKWVTLNGGDVRKLDHSQLQPCENITSLEFENAEQEMETCARWARAVIETNPELHRVGIVIPGIGNLHRRVRRIFSSILNPESILEKRQTGHLSFHITVGSQLRDLPMVVDALNVLELISTEVDINVMHSLLVSERMKGWEAERDARYRLADKLLGLGGSIVTIDGLVNLDSVQKISKCTIFIELLKEAKARKEKIQRFASYPYWGSFFVDWLDIFISGERKGRAFSTDESQVHEALLSTIGGIAELGLVSGKVGVQAALAKLKRSVSEKSLQARAARVPVQIGEDIAMLGQSFTHMWILNMNNQVFPRSPNPNPFIPRALQKQYKISNCSSELSAQALGERLKMLSHSTKNLVCSYSQSDQQQHHYLPSPFITDFKSYAEDERDKLSTYQDYQSLLLAKRNQCELFDDWKTTPVLDPKSVHSGRVILHDQSSCPFRAFARHRLYADELNQKEFGMSALMKGSIAHKLFEKLFQKFTTKSELVTKETEFLEYAKLQAESILEAENEARLHPFSAEHIELEVSRLVDLADQWHLIEIVKRQHDFKVIATEKSVEITIQEIPIKLRIDRIDAIDGGKMVIDYKTGNCKITDLEEEQPNRPIDPQLMVYACAEENVVEVAYAQIKRGDARLHGYSRKPKYSKKPRKVLDAFKLLQWRKILTELAEQFLNGESKADPLKSACQYCPYPPLCRLGDDSDQVVSIDRK